MRLLRLLLGRHPTGVQHILFWDRSTRYATMLLKSCYAGQMRGTTNGAVPLMVPVLADSGCK